MADDDDLRAAIPPAWPLLLHVLCLVASVAALLSALAGVPYRTAAAVAAILVAASGVFAIVGKRSLIRVRGLDLAKDRTDDLAKRASLDRSNAHLIGALLVLVGAAWLAIALVQD